MNESENDECEGAAESAGATPRDGEWEPPSLGEHEPAGAGGANPDDIAKTRESIADSVRRRINERSTRHVKHQDPEGACESARGDLKIEQGISHSSVPHNNSTIERLTGDGLNGTMTSSKAKDTPATTWLWKAKRQCSYTRVGVT